MTKKKKSILALAAVLLVALGVILAAVLPKKDTAQPDAGTTAGDSGDFSSVYVTENKRSDLKFKKTDALTATDTADGDVFSVPVDSLKACATENGGMLFYSENGLEEIRKTIVAMRDEEAEYRVYPYGENKLRIDKYMSDGSINTYSIVKTKDADGNEAYDLSDCRAFFISDNGEYAAFQFPFYYLDDAESFCGLDYGKFGMEFLITVTKDDFMRFYENSAMYIIKDGINGDFSLEHTFAVADKGNGYPIRFSFGTDADGRNTVKIEMGTVEQE